MQQPTIISIDLALRLQAGPGWFGLDAFSCPCLGWSGCELLQGSLGLKKGARGSALLHMFFIVQQAILNIFFYGRASISKTAQVFFSPTSFCPKYILYFSLIFSRLLFQQPSPWLKQALRQPKFKAEEVNSTSLVKRIAKSHGKSWGYKEG